MKTNEIENTNTLFTTDFYCSEMGYYQITVINGKVYFAQKTFPQICNLANLKNDEEKNNFKCELDNNRQIVLSEMIVNYVYCFTEKPETPYIMNMGKTQIDVFVPTTLTNKLEDNSIWENYLSDRFGEYKQFAKQWISAYCFFSEWEFQNGFRNKRLPIMILTGERSVGKTSFIELLSKIYGVNNYAKISKEVFAQRFDNWKSNKLVHLNESSTLDHNQYDKLKLTMGSDLVEIEKKGKDRIHAKNNISMVIDSNKKNPIYTVLSELPTDTTENQFFVTEFTELKQKNDRHLQLLEQSFYHYINTELREIFESEVVPNLNEMRWIIDTPITENLKQMFLINKTNLDYHIEEITTILKVDYLDTNKTFISNFSLEEIAQRVNAKSANYLKNDLIENGLIYPKSEIKKVNGKVIRGYYINSVTVKNLYGNNPIQTIDNVDTDYFDTETETENNIFSLLG